MSIFGKLFSSDDVTNPPKPDSDMQKVLDALAKLDGKPIETLDPAEARKQPTPTDAVKRVLGERGKPPTDDMGIDTHEITIPGPGGPLPARVFRPKHTEDEKLPVVVY